MKVKRLKLYTKKTKVVDLQIKDSHNFSIGKSKIIVHNSFIRPRGSVIKGTGILHPGVISYLDVFDSVSECIVKGADDGYVDKIKNYFKDEEFEKLKSTLKAQTRKGAQICVLRVDHPDIEEYIKAKQTSGRLTKFNMSVGITDEFMLAYKNDELFDLKFNGKVSKRVKAKDLYNLIMDSTYNRGEPGVIFLDNAMLNNPLEYVDKITATNPCSEILGFGSLTSVCLLGNSNLTMYVKIGDDKKSYFDFEEFEKDVKIFLRMLDNVCDLSRLPLQSYEFFVENFRMVGVGVSGLGSTLLMLDIPYNSEEAIEFTKKVCSLKENALWHSSVELAKEKGTFPQYNKEKFTNTTYFKSDRITEETKSLIRKYGVRNSKTSTAPPNGNSSVICDYTSNGIEPIFDLEVVRKVVCDWPEGLTTDNVKTSLKQKKQNDFIYWEGMYQGKKYYYEPHNRGLCEVRILRDYGYQWLINNFPNKVNNNEALITTKNLDVKNHLDIQEAVQYYNNQSTSKTVNIPNKYPFSKFKDIYFEAWERGLIGLTTYRDGSMESVLESIEEAEEKKEIIEKGVKLPTEFINGPTKTIKKEGMKFYINLSYFPEDKNLKYPIAIWIKTNSKGEAISCNRACKSLVKLAVGCGIKASIVEDTFDKCLGDTPHNRLGRMISLCLRHNVPREDILISLRNIEGDHISSLLTAVRKFISETIHDGTEIKGEKCPNCKGESLVMQSGCFTCTDCGFAGCN